jgi:hypothetical protein
MLHHGQTGPLVGAIANSGDGHLEFYNKTAVIAVLN